MHFKTLCRLFNNAAKLIASVKERKSSQLDVDLIQSTQGHSFMKNNQRNYFCFQFYPANLNFNLDL